MSGAPASSSSRMEGFRGTVAACATMNGSRQTSWIVNRGSLTGPTRNVTSSWPDIRPAIRSALSQALENADVQTGLEVAGLGEYCWEQGRRYGLKGPDRQPPGRTIPYLGHSHIEQICAGRAVCSRPKDFPTDGVERHRPRPRAPVEDGAAYGFLQGGDLLGDRRLRSSRGSRPHVGRSRARARSGVRAGAGTRGRARSLHHHKPIDYISRSLWL